LLIKINMTAMCFYVKCRLDNPSVSNSYVHQYKPIVNDVILISFRAYIKQIGNP